MKAIAIALLVGLVSCSGNSTNSTNGTNSTNSSRGNAEKWAAYNVEVNQGGIADFYADALRVANSYEKNTRKEADAVHQALADSYRTTSGKIILGFGQNVVPVLREALTVVASRTKLGPGCDQNKALVCFKIEGDGEVAVDQQCLKKVNCELSGESLTRAQKQTQEQNVGRAAAPGVQWGQQLGQGVAQRLAPAVQAYQKKAASLQGEWNTFFAKHAVNELGCERSCVQACLNKTFVNFNEVPDCVRWCPCEQRVVRLGEGTYSYPELMSFVNYDLEAWQYFKANM